MSLWSRLANVVQPGRVDRELDEELLFHLDERIHELMAAGMTREAATDQATRRFGNRLRLREQSRDIKLLPWLDSVGRDVRLGVRMLRKHAVVTATAMLSLSLALGACVAAFSLVDALILRSLPVREPAELVHLAFPTGEPARPESDTFNDPTFVRLRDAGRGSIDLFAMSTQVMRAVRFDATGEREQLRTQFSSGDAFERLGVAAAAGRLIAASDDVARGGHPIAVLGHAFWRQRFGGDPTIVGRQLLLDEVPYEIVGVASAGFTGVEPGRPTDLWLPYAMYNPRAFDNHSFNWFRIVGRMHSNVTPRQAQAILQTTFTNYRRDIAPRMFSRAQAPELATRFVEAPLFIRSAESGISPLRRQFERPLWILAAIAASVLLIAGSNIATLLLARSAAREREMALRLSIGAGRGQLIQQALVESAVVAGAACAIGVAFAVVAAPAVVGMLAATDDPLFLDLRLNWRTAAFAGAITLLTTALFGLVPALRASSVAPLTALKTGGRSSNRMSGMGPFVAFQTGFALVVLFVGGLLVLSFARLSNVNPGFATSDVALINLESIPRVDPQQHRAALFNLLDRLRRVEGVEAVSFAEFNLLGRAWTRHMPVPGRPFETIETTMAPVAPGFFETMQIPVLAGRSFDARDMAATSVPILVNEAFATRYFGRERAVGRALEARFGETDALGVHEVIGLVPDSKYDLRQPAAPTIYIPLTPRTNGTIHLRMTGNETAAGSRLREEVRASGMFRVASITSQSAVIGRSMVRERLLALLSGFFALVGLLLAAVGLYGVLSDAVVQRTREIGIRVALGASQRSVIGTVVSEVGLTAAVGAAVGLGAGLYLARFLELVLFDVKPLEASSLALPLATALLAACVAILGPAIRATRVDPVIALRHD